ncbi:MAG TPA: V-type ATP synthase subunit A [Candidatus Binataceae bacterium]|nr:V-type ATP synthase subunit A [Candidatus Binataceae bacterium]
MASTLAIGATELASVAGTVNWVSGPVVRVIVQDAVFMGELMEVGEDRLVGEVIELSGDQAVLQVYESTEGLGPGAPVFGTRLPLFATLGPGLIGGIFDGIQRPLRTLKQAAGAFIQKGVKAAPLDPDRRWRFVPGRKAGDEVTGGEILGSVQESEVVQHRTLVPPGVAGELVSIAAEGEYTVNDTIAVVRAGKQEVAVAMAQRWPVKQPRPYRKHLVPAYPLVTGQRIFDLFFPLAKGGTAAIPGGFGTGKTVMEHQLAKWAQADVIVHVGCGERGNEMAEVLQVFPELRDPRTGRSLMEKTVLIANTSNMPVAAREASIYTGITIAEYYRDMGYSVALTADSTSRWAEALREVSGRLEEMPAEEGFPAYLATRLAQFYERAGRVDTLCGQEGSVTLIGAVSPAGGDFSEPVTQHTKRFVRCFWALDKDLAAARYFPAINYLDSYSGYLAEVAAWWEREIDSQWRELREDAMRLLQEDNRLQRIVRLIGEDALPDEQRLTIDAARLLQEACLQQNANDPADTFCRPEKQIAILRAILHFVERAREVTKKGAPIHLIQEAKVRADIVRAKEKIPNDRLDLFAELMRATDQEMDALLQEVQRTR